MCMCVCMCVCVCVFVCVFVCVGVEGAKEETVSFRFVIELPTNVGPDNQSAVRDYRSIWHQVNLAPGQFGT